MKKSIGNLESHTPTANIQTHGQGAKSWRGTLSGIEIGWKVLPGIVRWIFYIDITNGARSTGLYLLCKFEAIGRVDNRRQLQRCVDVYCTKPGSRCPDLPLSVLELFSAHEKVVIPVFYIFPTSCRRLTSG